MKKWTITFENGYCGCDLEETFEGTEEYDNYIGNCYYTITESEDEE